MSLLLILLAFGFVFLNAFFVAAEFSLVKVRHSRVEQLKQQSHFQGKILARVHEKLEVYLSACQLGITLASLGLGWIGEPAFADALAPLFRGLGIHSHESIELISFAIAFSLISFLHIVVGELMPKTMAIRQSEKLSLYTAIPLYLFYWLMYPFIWLLNQSANVLLKLFGLDAIHPGELTYSPEEIKFILKSTHVHESLNQEHALMLIRMLEFVNLQAVDIMRPLEEMISINQDLTPEEKFAVIKKYRYTRYPVYQEKRENILGVLHTKDLVVKEVENALTLRPVVKVYRHTKAVTILERFRKGMPNFAIVYYRHKPIGFITLDNLLHALIGKMQDEFHLTKEDWVAESDGSFLIKGSAPVSLIEKHLGVDLSLYPVDTVAGLLLHNLGHLPSEGETWEHPAFMLRAEKRKGTRVTEIRLYLKNS